MQIAPATVWMSTVRRRYSDEPMAMGAAPTSSTLSRKKTPVGSELSLMTSVAAAVRNATTPTNAAVRNRRRPTLAASSAAMSVNHSSSTVSRRAHAPGGPPAITA